MASDTRLTLELLMRALRGLLPEEGSTAGTDPEKLVENLARRALSGFALSIKYLLAKNGEAIVSGLGTFSFQDGQILYHPDDDLLQYVLLSEPDSERRSKLTGLELLRNLETAASLVGMVREHLDTLQIPGQATTSDEELMLTAFGEVPAKRLKSSVEHLLGDIFAQFRAAGVPLNVGGPRSAAEAAVVPKTSATETASQTHPASEPPSSKRLEKDSSIKPGSARSSEGAAGDFEAPASAPPPSEVSARQKDSETAGSPVQPPGSGRQVSTTPSNDASVIDVKKMDAAEILRILREDTAEVPSAPVAGQGAVGSSSVPGTRETGAKSAPASPEPPPKPPAIDFSGLTEFPDFAVGHEGSVPGFSPARQPPAEPREAAVPPHTPSRNVVAFPEKESPRFEAQPEERPVPQEAQLAQRSDSRMASKGTVMTVKNLDNLMDPSLNVFENTFDAGSRGTNVPDVPPEPPVGDLPLSWRSHEALRKAGITTLPAILRLSEAELVAAIGVESALEIKNMLQVRGLALRS